MLTASQTAIVKATVPVLQEYGEAITGFFYRSLFEAHPELYDIFNPANQRDGGQARSLAASICAYAANIDHLEALGGMVDRIAHKHGSLEVLPEHYPIVGHHLLLAIRGVLGEAATDDVLDAWGAAYGQLAEVMIGAEAQLYAEGEKQTGGWRGFKPFTVVGKVPESAQITSFYLRPADGAPLPAFRPGQYVSVRLDDIPGQSHAHIRQYSLSDAPGAPHLRISVKREPAPVNAPADAPSGVVSNYLHEKIREGDLLNIHVPLGDFALEETSTRPVVLLGGGVGSTPLISMLLHLDRQRSEREVVYVHAVLGREHHAFRDAVARVIRHRPNVRRAVFYAQCSPDDQQGADYEEEGLICRENLSRYLPANPADADYYCCGPAGFMAAANAILDELGVPASRRHQETFGPSPRFATA